MMRKTLTFTALAASLTAVATPAAADENAHEVLLLGIGVFPRVTYVDAGDTVRFVNESDDAQYILGKDDAWGVGPINAGETVDFTVPAGLKNFFVTTTDDTASYDDFNGENEPVAPDGVINFGSPPLG